MAKSSEKRRLNVGPSTSYGTFTEDSKTREIQFFDCVPQGVVKNRRSPFGNVKIVYYAYCTSEKEVDEKKANIKSLVGTKSSKIITIYYVPRKWSRGIKCAVGAILNKDARIDEHIAWYVYQMTGYDIVDLPDMKKVYSYTCTDEEGAINKGSDEINKFLMKSNDANAKVKAGPLMAVHKKNMILLLKPVNNKNDYYLY